MKKQPQAFSCIEGTGYFAENCSSREEAWGLILGEIPDSEEKDFDRTIDELKYVTAYKCLDCDSSWVSDDVCGECGEFRLSKRPLYWWYLEC